MIQTIKEAFDSGLREDVYVVKKGKKYLTIKNGELGKTTKQNKAVLFKTVDEINEFIQYACIDTRNAEVIGGSYDIVPVYLSQSSG